LVQASGEAVHIRSPWPRHGATSALLALVRPSGRLGVPFLGGSLPSARYKYDLRTWLLALTDFGDAAVLLPLTATMLLWLIFSTKDKLRFAAWWGISVCFCVGITAALKIFFYGCPPVSDLHSPSGHIGFSVLVYGAIALATAVHTRGVFRILAVAIGSALILTIAMSRLLLEIHTLPEVGLGLIIGTLSLALFGRTYLQSPRAEIWPLIVMAAILLTILHGQELHAEEFLHLITGYFHLRCS
jgi:hypothetical protein